MHTLSKLVAVVVVAQLVAACGDDGDDHAGADGADTVADVAPPLSREVVETEFWAAMNAVCEIPYGKDDFWATEGDPECLDLETPLLACLVPEITGCANRFDFLAGAATKETGIKVDIAMDKVYVLPDDPCMTLAQPYLDCLHCRKSAGYGDPKPGLGAACSADSDCAEGFTCPNGFCTRACSFAGDCEGTHWGEFACIGVVGPRQWECDGVCRMYCTSDAECQVLHADGTCPLDGNPIELCRFGE